ncbi:Ubc6p like ubiquiting conjugating enzyme [Cryptosporidium ubiquitum]|uniref:Ubc6p like ubiquiting conjugating enzyme n=1 Tax=Cryptosporidium ubiquitum TaxID=857276 RepID=A0A1J4MHX9_9CRYT|nr:Ubc6p like ubiquiting conjugating enzyme [Cryptosporidium ubiquitum]OII73816.1 Ubc6p like ubiquiting conjugating enzyme [Cryptosporidium ubiquitum]
MHQTGARGVSSSGITSVQCLSRILREYREIQKEPSSYWCAFPINMDEPYEWHFTIKGPAGTEFEGGMYHGRILLPHSYPFSPPSLMMLTGNGRFEVGKKVCLSASNYHPELWQPAWGIRTMLDALHAFFPTPGEGAIHSLDWSPEIRKKLAKDSVNWRCNTCQETNMETLSRLSPEDQTTYSRESTTHSENPLIQHINKCISESKTTGNGGNKDKDAENISDKEDERKSTENNQKFGTEESKSLEVTDRDESYNNLNSKDQPSSQQVSSNQHLRTGEIPPNRLPPRISQQSIAWSLILVKKPSNILEGVATLIDLLIGVLLITIFLLSIRLFSTFIL